MNNGRSVDSAVRVRVAKNSSKAPLFGPRCWMISLNVGSLGNAKLYFRAFRRIRDDVARGRRRVKSVGGMSSAQCVEGRCTKGRHGTRNGKWMDERAKLAVNERASIRRWLRSQRPAGRTRGRAGAGGSRDLCNYRVVTDSVGSTSAYAPGARVYAIRNRQKRCYSEHWRTGKEIETQADGGGATADGRRQTGLSAVYGNATTHSLRDFT